jgi:hypothetical protein
MVQLAITRPVAHRIDAEIAAHPRVALDPYSGVGRAMRAAPMLYGPAARIGVVGLRVARERAGVRSRAIDPRSWMPWTVDPWSSSR